MTRPLKFLKDYKRIPEILETTRQSRTPDRIFVRIIVTIVVTVTHPHKWNATTICAPKLVDGTGSQS